MTARDKYEQRQWAWALAHAAERPIVLMIEDDSLTTALAISRFQETLGRGKRLNRRDFTERTVDKSFLPILPFHWAGRDFCLFSARLFEDRPLAVLDIARAAEGCSAILVAHGGPRWVVDAAKEVLVPLARHLGLELVIDVGGDPARARKCGCAQPECDKCGPLVAALDSLARTARPRVSDDESVFVYDCSQSSWGVRSGWYAVGGLSGRGRLRQGMEVELHLADGARMLATISSIEQKRAILHLPKLGGGRIVAVATPGTVKWTQSVRFDLAESSPLLPEIGSEYLLVGVGGGFLGRGIAPGEGRRLELTTEGSATRQSGILVHLAEPRAALYRPNSWFWQDGRPPTDPQVVVWGTLIP